MTDGATRRALLGGGMALLASGIARAQIVPGDETVRLWPGTPPGAPGAAITRKVEARSTDPAHPHRWVTGIDTPVMVVRRPARPNGAAVLLLPGGGYGFVSYDNEGTEQTAWLNARGITAFILLYRLPGEGWSDRARVPLQDAQRAIRLIRADAARWRIDSRRVAVLGFSAGGHLAGSLATRHAEATYGPVDRADALSARPDIAGMMYPVVSMAAPFAHGGSRDNLLGRNASEAARGAASVERAVTADTPAAFLLHAGDDPVVPVANSLALYEALRTAGRPVDLHLFAEGGHGFAYGIPPALPAAAWPELFHAWGMRQGIFAA